MTKTSGQFSVLSFSTEDLMTHHKAVLKVWLNLGISMLVCAGLFGIFFAAIQEFRDHANVVFIPFAIPMMFFLGLAISKFVRLARDKREQTKICGELDAQPEKIEGEKSTKYLLRIRTKTENHRIGITSSIYHRLVPDVKTYIEFSRHAHTILRLTQGENRIVP